MDQAEHNSMFLAEEDFTLSSKDLHEEFDTFGHIPSHVIKPTRHWPTQPSRSVKKTVGHQSRPTQQAETGLLDGQPNEPIHEYLAGQ
jgi:hypothetical protein